ncbi:MAG: D-Ala-D-Ala carboxypeptidase family metallohydrolase [Gemmatimonadaceae bacterium]
MNQRLGTLAIALAAAVAVLGFYRPPRSLLVAPFGGDSAVAGVAPATTAFGRSGAVHLQLARPGDPVYYPLAMPADSLGLSYEWVPLDSQTPTGTAARANDSAFVAPAAPGLYQLGIARNGERRALDAITVAVMIPFEDKHGATLDGYRLGIFMAEKKEGHERPLGFVKISADVADLPITKHLRLGDFLSRQERASWPRYAAVSARVLDKVELVVAEVLRMRGDTTRPRITMTVHSGFRAPVFNRTVRRAAKDSRHQYGDAMDVAIDADGDGKLTRKDVKLVAQAAESVELAYPDLVGGVGVYTSRRYPHPYVHIDARGKRARWRS